MRCAGLLPHWVRITPGTHRRDTLHATALGPMLLSFCTHLMHPHLLAAMTPETAQPADAAAAPCEMLQILRGLTSPELPAAAENRHR